MAIDVAVSCRPAGVKSTETIAFAIVACWRFADPTLSLEDLRATLQEAVIDENFEQQDRTIEEAVGKIDPKEPDVVQAMRRALRLRNKTWNTEKA